MALYISASQQAFYYFWRLGPDILQFNSWRLSAHLKGGLAMSLAGGSSVNKFKTIPAYTVHRERVSFVSRCSRSIILKDESSFSFHPQHKLFIVH